VTKASALKSHTPAHGGGESSFIISQFDVVKSRVSSGECCMEEFFVS